jgi:hypothetical protein
MRFLADAGISPKTVDFLRQRGHDAVHALQRAADSELVVATRAVVPNFSPHGLNPRAGRRCNLTMRLNP